jgi:hypothetical protein
VLLLLPAAAGEGTGLLMALIGEGERRHFDKQRRTYSGKSSSLDNLDKTDKTSPLIPAVSVLETRNNSEYMYINVKQNASRGLFPLNIR